MQIRRPHVKRPARRAAAVIGTAPLMVALAVSSISITVVVVLGTVSQGRVPASGPLGLVCAVVLAAVAAAEASRPARSERVRRRTAPPPTIGQQASGVDAPTASPWR
jgi:hypothetical protein